MGVGKIVRNIFLGPFLVYALLMAHVMYQSFVKTPAQALTETPSWPSTVSAGQKAELIAQRKVILEEYVDAWTGGKWRDFSPRRLTKDFQFEDPFMKLSGAKEMGAVIGALSKYVNEVKVDVHNELHAPHEIIVNQTITGKIGGWNWPSFTMTAHYLLEPPGKKGEPERIFKLYEEYRGNPLLNERTFVPFLVGTVHAKLRVFHGHALNWIVNKGLM